jgi:cell division protein FtsQ
VRREAGRRRLHILLLISAAAGVVALAVGALYSPLLNVRHIRVIAPASVSRAEVLSIAGLSHPRPLTEIDTRAVAARLNAVPRLGGARVRKSWPTTLLVSVLARFPVAVVARGTPPGAPPSTGGPPWATVDATGRVLANVNAAPGLPMLEGAGHVPAPGGWLAGSPGPAVIPPSGASNRSLVDLDAPADGPTIPTGMAAALGLATALPASLRSEVMSVGVAPGNQLTMAVLPSSVPIGSIPVQLGDGSRLAAKLTSLATLLGQANLSGVVGINLTVPDRPAVLTARQTGGTVSTHAGG